MGWTPKGDAACDTCGTVRMCIGNRHQAIQMMRVAGWRHMKGETLGGQEFETILCRDCASNEHRRVRTKSPLEQDELPLQWDTERKSVGGQGISSR